METPLALEDLRVEEADAEEAAERGHHLLVLGSEALAWLGVRVRVGVRDRVRVRVRARVGVRVSVSVRVG